jgi:phage tail sheath protein FI
MAEYLSPGVFIEEVPSNVQVVAPVSASNLGAVGATHRGPDNEATLVTSYPQYERIFGPLIAESRLGLSMAAFFQNGGKRAFIVRVMPSDATSGSGGVTSDYSDHKQNEGDGTIVVVTNAALGGSALKFPVQGGAGAVTFEWRSAGTPVVAEQLKQPDGTTNLTSDGSATAYLGRINPTSLPTLDPHLFCVDPAAATFDIIGDPAGTPVTISLDTVDATKRYITNSVTTYGNVTLDLYTGIVVIVPATPANWPAAAAIQISYTPCEATESCTTDASNNLTGDVSTGSVTVADGTYTFTCTNAPVDDSPINVTYSTRAWTVAPKSVGTWFGEIRVEAAGNADYYDAATNTFSRYNVNITMLNSETSLYDVWETYEEVTFTDSTSTQYFPDVVNDLSDLLTITTPADNEEAPNQLNGAAMQQVVGAGDGIAAAALEQTLLGEDVSPRSVTITYTSGSTEYTITDDGAGALIGSVDSGGTNTISYTTGAIDVTPANIPNANTLIVATWRAVAAESTATDTMTAGTDGTFTSSSTYGRSQFSSYAALASSYHGIYALSRVEELMQVIVPDFAGDINITKDLFDYADLRASQPSGGDRFVIITSPAGSTAQEAADFFRFDVNQSCKFAAMYWPWVRIPDPLADNRLVTFPPLGHIAGIYARVDSTRNVGKSPGGTVDGALRGVTELEVSPTKGEMDYLYPKRINCLMDSTATGLAVMGVRTLSSDSSWRYINVRRLFMFLEASIYNATFWIIFENNGPQLWTRIKSQIQSFLLAVYNDGMLAGSSPAQAFFVTVDETNNPPESIDQGQVIIDIGVAPSKPAEFVRFRLQQKTVNS